MALNDHRPDGTPRPADAPAESGSEHQLPCGIDLDELWHRFDANTLTDHDRSCEHCQAAVRGFEALQTATVALSRSEDRPEPKLLDTIMSAVRTEVRRGRRIPLPSGDFGSVDVYEQAVATVLRDVVDNTGDGAVARSCRVRYDETATADGPDGVVDLTLSLTAPHDVTLPELLTGIRDRLARTAETDFGVVVRRIDLVVEDLSDVPAPQASPEPDGPTGPSADRPPEG